MKTFRSQRGVSLIELLVSMVIGLVVVGAIVVNYTSTGATSARQTALGQMGEDAQLAFNLLARDLQMAGYSEPTKIDAAATTFTKIYSGRPMFACATPMVNPKVALSGSKEDGVTCTAAGPSVSTATHALVVNYQGTNANAVLNAANVPTNCLGSEAIAMTTVGPPVYNYRFVSNRYYVDTSGTTGRPELKCAAPGEDGQPLIENVEAMRISLGQADAANPRRPVRYVAPDQLVGGDWGTVVAVRICLLMRSSEKLLAAEDDNKYIDCSGAEVASADGRLRRAFYSTVALRNKTAF
ncbi:PilW family protein [Ramlibacter sp. USB13]|uniref:PilW family protein n=1 Tax=Ramlibacter cellulosilyticus TaxID=2764187 RepID=A0A923SCI9_9BURK|nr:PilW family protein [Ramlibacter cellulosilyticus]MBC5785005.1 PilW family protein [Ramlibacter cellulosilyticus]